MEIAAIILNFELIIIRKHYQREMRKFAKPRFGIHTFMHAVNLPIKANVGHFCQLSSAILSFDYIGQLL